MQMVDACLHDVVYLHRTFHHERGKVLDVHATVHVLLQFEFVFRVLQCVARFKKSFTLCETAGLSQARLALWKTWNTRNTNEQVVR